MGKVSIGLRGWRFDESAVFTEDGELRPLDEIPEDDRRRLDRLPTLMKSPCQACWLVFGDAEIERCNVPDVVYGEPLAEVALCTDHETDFVYWFRDEEGSDYVGTDDLQDEFFEWFADGGRAPEDYPGVEHVDTDPDDVPRPPEPDPAAFATEQPDDDGVTVDLREYGDVLASEYPTREDDASGDTSSGDGAGGDTSSGDDA